MDTRTRRATSALGALAVLPLLATAACAPGGAQQDGGSGPAAITVEHALGTVELAAPPERVVTLSPADTDLALALGVTPVAMAAFWGTDSGIAPWQEKALSGGDPAILRPDADGAIPIEQVAAAEPDVILATGLYTIDGQYERLDQIAPTLAY
ncbi:ABC transporter substrate-binding protein [Marinactinospora rubrisoli]|uniref:ABC transporter substrate-binding protein n=1 Tax=Marinactinospora rubrisoli TaxID=2715399 RepID=A0ABW2KLG2_9ACTN